MKKPHEEEWTPEDVIVMHNRHDGQKEAREVLGHAAPDMARALLAVRRPEFGPPCWCINAKEHRAPAHHEDECEQARAALTKAGVPL